jgi:hypothetical protein
VSPNTTKTEARTHSSRPAAPSALRHDLDRQGIGPDTLSGRWILRLLSSKEQGKRNKK